MKTTWLRFSAQKLNKILINSILFLVTAQEAITKLVLIYMRRKFYQAGSKEFSYGIMMKMLY